jgi:hypothetical protein
MGFYDEMQDMASEMLAEFKQGTVTLTREEEIGPGPNPWDPPVTAPVTYVLDAAVRRVAQKYVDGTLIIATDNQVTFAVPAIVPAMTDTLTIDGVVQVMKALRPIPAAGTVVAYIAFVAG